MSSEEAFTLVTLHIYDVGTDASVAEVNKILQAVGTGAFHGGVEVFGQEWSYGYSDEGTGVFCCEPRECQAHRYRESIAMGETIMTPRQVGVILDRLMKEWVGTQYDLLNRNCVLFCDAMIRKLGVGPMPTWVSNLAGAGATLRDAGVIAARTSQQAAEGVEAAAIIAAAKAGELDKQYNIRDRANSVAETAVDAASRSATHAAVLASQATERATELDKQYRLRERAADAAFKTKEQATILALMAANKASELDQQYNIKEQSMMFARKAAEGASSLASRAVVTANEMERHYWETQQAQLKEMEPKGSPRRSQGTITDCGGCRQQCEMCPVQ
eukprot:TRINITY_DN44830_c0_g1_i1.p1 TRINITY_DN44830_c0_g1~~TRINITY_DN44830_c0_g1_i1.p1  ORF type:complete len:352 (+),score=79.84 TRINITY_DN44830_c0_g1_i1:65-1057(+)